MNVSLSFARFNLMLLLHLKESAKLRALQVLMSYGSQVPQALDALVPHVRCTLELSCLVLYVLSCLTCRVSYILSCFTCLIPYVFSCLTCLMPYVLSFLTCLTCLLPYTLTCFTYLIPYNLTCSTVNHYDSQPRLMECYNSGFFTSDISLQGSLICVNLTTLIHQPAFIRKPAL